MPTLGVALGSAWHSAGWTLGASTLSVTCQRPSERCETVANKIVNTVKLLGLSRFDLKYSNGTLPHDKLMTSIELYGTKVVPRVRELLAS